jgi:hypothetical protein
LTEAGDRSQAESHLGEALTRCRRIHLVELEPSILLAWARWHRAGHRDAAASLAAEGLATAERCGYRLNLAELHNFFALLALDSRESTTVRHHANKAREYARCATGPYVYKVALEETQGLEAPRP